MRRDKLIEMLSGIEIDIPDHCRGRISNKSCQDIADFIQDEMKEQRQRESDKKVRATRKQDL